MCPKHFTMPKNNRAFWRAKLVRNVERDRKVGLELRRLGWKVVRVWEHDVVDHMDRCVERIQKVLKSG